MNTIKITSRELEVLRMIASENTTTDIASRLHLSPHTIASHRQSIIFKLGVKNTAGLIRRSFELGYLQLPNNYSMRSAQH